MRSFVCVRAANELESRDVPHGRSRLAAAMQHVAEPNRAVVRRACRICARATQSATLNNARVGASQLWKAVIAVITTLKKLVVFVTS